MINLDPQSHHKRNPVSYTTCCIHSPTRSVLSPLLFLVYINDITCVISIGKISVYADNMHAPPSSPMYSPVNYILLQLNTDFILVL